MTRATTRITFLLIFVFGIFQSADAQCPIVAPVPNNACYQNTILNDSWCCYNAWDFICQGEYDDCMLFGPCPVVAPVPNDACYQQVIANDSWCCNNAWDALCQSAYDACNPGGGGPAIAGDCPDAIPICTINNFSIDPNGYGTMDELCIGCTSNPSSNPVSANSGCLLSGELNSTWFSIAVVTGGSMEFSFGAPGGGNCYDWAMWSYNASTCTNIANNTQAPIRCNWNGTCDSYTGIGPTPPGGYANNFEPSMPVNVGDQFILCFSNYSSAYTNVPIAFSGTANIDCIPLSMEVQSLVATEYPGYNELNWNTVAEINCSHYELLRSTDGMNYTSIGTVEASGTTMEASSYRFEDYSPEMGLNYYRVNQVKFDGTTVPSNIAMANHEISRSFQVISTYPNPAEDQLSVSFQQRESGVVVARIVDLSGTELYSTSRFFPSGTNELQIELPELNQGMYLLQLEQISSRQTQSVKVAIR